MIQILSFYYTEKTSFLLYAIISTQAFFVTNSTPDLMSLMSFERVTSFGLLLVAVWWLSMERKKEREIFLEQLQRLKSEKDAIIAEKEKRIDHLINNILAMQSQPTHPS